MTTQDGSRLLIEEHPLQVLPSLAARIGLNEAIIVQQMHYWLRASAHQRDGKTWIYNTYEEWQTQFPFWSVRTIQRIVTGMEQRGIVESTTAYNPSPLDRTKWYTLNYTALHGDDPELPSRQLVVMDIPNAEMAPPIIPNDMTIATTCRDDHDKLSCPLGQPVVMLTETNVQETNVQETTDRIDRATGPKTDPASGGQQPIVAGLIDLGLTRGQALMAIRVERDPTAPPLDLAEIERWRSWIETSDKERPIGYMIAVLRAGGACPVDPAEAEAAAARERERAHWEAVRAAQPPLPPIDVNAPAPPIEVDPVLLELRRLHHLKQRKEATRMLWQPSSI